MSVAGGCVREAKRICPTFDPKFNFTMVVPLPYDKVLPRYHYFLGGHGWKPGEGCAEKKTGALRSKDIEGFGTLTHRLERIAETDAAYCHEYTILEPKGSLPAEAGWHGCCQVFKVSEDSESTIIMYAGTWKDGDLDAQMMEMANDVTGEGVKDAVADLLPPGSD